MNRLFGPGRNAFLTGAIAWGTDTVKAMLVDLATADTANKLITGVTAASPMVVTSNAHGFSNGDIVTQGGISGVPAANGTFVVQNVTANTYELAQLAGGNTTGTGSYTGGGWAVNLTLGTNLQDIDNSRVGTDVALSGMSAALGVANASSWTHSNVSGTAKGVVLYKDTGSAATSKLILFIDGRTLVTADAQAASSATTIVVEPLKHAIPNGAVLYFSNGVSATLTVGASVGDRTLTVSALASAIPAGASAEPSYSGSGVPISTTNGTVQMSVDTGVNKLFAL